MIEKAFIIFLDGIIRAIGNLADIFVKNQAWGVVAALFIFLAAVLYFVRKDRLVMDDKVSNLLETRNAQVLQAFKEATAVVDAMDDLVDRVNMLDQRCDIRQRLRGQKRKGDQA